MAVIYRCDGSTRNPSPRRVKRQRVAAGRRHPLSRHGNCMGTVGDGRAPRRCGCRGPECEGSVVLQNSVLVAFNAFMTLKGGKLTLGNLLGFFDAERGSKLIENEALSS